MEQHRHFGSLKQPARRTLARGIALLTLGAVRPLHAQMEIGTWVRHATDSTPAMAMKVEACCNGGRRLTYHIPMGGGEMVLTVESPFDGTEVPVLANGQPSGETMAITRLDAHHASTIVKMNGSPFGTSRATLSADGRTLTVLNDFSASVGAQRAGKFTEVWVKQQ
jgi:hypothetical protein